MDLAGIHAMNQRIGFPAVDSLVKELFSIQFRRSDIVARWYSGDEIVIVFDGETDSAAHKIGQLREKSTEKGMRNGTTRR